MYMYKVIFGEMNDLVQVKETAGRSVDLNTDKYIKFETRLIAKAQECPIVTGIFGTFLNPFCHLRSDLN